MQCLYISRQLLTTVNVDIFAHFAHGSDARKHDVSENITHYRLNGIIITKCAKICPGENVT